MTRTAFQVATKALYPASVSERGGGRYDLIVIGSGPAGEKGAAQAAYFGKRVAVVERAPVPGGAAVHTGTLPSKTLRESALYLSGHRARSLYGVAVELAPDATLQGLMRRKRAIADVESARIHRNLGRHDIDYVQGHGRLASPHSVEVTHDDGTTTVLEGEFILLATGSRPYRPKDIEFASPLIHDSDEVLEIDELPRSLTVLGGGVIGCEYACMFAALGIPVTLVDARPEILPFIDEELVQRLKTTMQEGLGVRFLQDVRWGAIRLDGDGVATELSTGEQLHTHHLLFAAGRSGRTEDLGLERAGLEANTRGHVEVDEAFRTKVPSVLAAGDVVGFPALASTSMEQGRVAVCHAFGFSYKRAVSALLPYGLYTIPEVSQVGETEASCKEKGIDHVVGRAFYVHNARGQITGDTEGMTKLVVDAQSRRILGVHVVGERATELVHIGQMAMLREGTVDDLIEMVFNFPTLAESYKYAAYDCLGAFAKRGG